MSDPEQLFTRELYVFRTEAQAGAQFLYAYLAFKAIIGENRNALSLVNRTPLFWKTNIGALQTSFFIVFGRIFDQRSEHNIDKLLKIAESNIDIFSKASLAARKRRESANADEWLDEYLRRSYEPTKHDFRELRRKIKDNRKIYEANYRDIRHKIYAHKEITEAAEERKLFSKTNVRELQNVFKFVNSLHEALWQMLHNGQKLVLRPMRYSVKNIMLNRKPEFETKPVQEMIVGEVQDFFKLFMTAAQQGAQPDAQKRRAG